MKKLRYKQFINSAFVSWNLFFIMTSYYHRISFWGLDDLQNFAFHHIIEQVFTYSITGAHHSWFECARSALQKYTFIVVAASVD